MKRLSLLFTIFILLFTVQTSMATGLGIQAGMATSAFQDQASAANTFVGGAHFVFDWLPLIDVGAEYTMTLSPYTFETTAFGQTLTSEISQSYFGAFVRVFLPIPLIVINPYIKGGMGYYSGKFKVTAAGRSDSADLKSTLGYSLGLGVKSIVGLYGEFVYNFVSHELDVENPDNLAYNNWMIMVGYSFGL